MNWSHLRKALLAAQMGLVLQENRGVMHVPVRAPGQKGAKKGGAFRNRLLRA